MSATPAPTNAGFQLRVTPTASTIVKASTTSTNEPRNAALTVEAMVVKFVIFFLSTCFMFSE